MVSTCGKRAYGGHITVACEIVGQVAALHDADGNANQHQSGGANEGVARTQKPPDKGLESGKGVGKFGVGMLDAPPHGVLETGRQFGCGPGIAQDAAQTRIVWRGSVHVNPVFIVIVSGRTDNRRKPDDLLTPWRVNSRTKVAEVGRTEISDKMATSAFY